MTEAEWLGARDSWILLRILEQENPSRRKIRLYLSACCRLIYGEPSRYQGVQEAVLVSERFADGLATESDLCTAQDELDDWRKSNEPFLFDPTVRALRLAIGLQGGFERGDYPSISKALWLAKFMRGPRLYDQLPSTERSQVGFQSDLLRDIFGNPFCPTSHDPAWLHWNGGIVAHLAQQAYDERALPSGELDKTRLALLADALEDAGCSEAAILDHLRAPGPHIRGCWVVDLLLVKG